MGYTGATCSLLARGLRRWLTLSSTSPAPADREAAKMTSRRLAVSAARMILVLEGSGIVVAT